MTFSDQVQDNRQPLTTLISIRPRVRLRSWVDAAIGGQNVWSIPWTKKNVIGVYDRMYDTLDEHDNYAAMAADKGSFFFDEDAEILWANFSDVPNILLESINPNFRVVAIEWDIFYATAPLNWHRNPADAGSPDQVWEGGLQKPPVPSQGNPDLLFGFSPVRVTDVQIAMGDESELLEELYSWSLNGSRVKIWECAGPLSSSNISEVFTGTAGSYALQAGVLSIEVTDPMSLVNQAIEGKYFSDGDFPAINPANINSPIRMVFGCVEGFIPVNIDYDEVAATNKNRDWVVSQNQADKAQLVTEIVVGSPDNANNASKVLDASGFRAGDSIVVEQGGVATYDIFVSSVDYLNNVIHHTTIGGRVIASGDEIRRGFIGTISYDDDNGSVYLLSYERDWTEVDTANDTKGFVLADNFEANLAGAPAIFDPALHKIYLTVYGDAIAPKKLNGIDPFCDLADNGGALANPVGLLWDILRNKIRTLREVVAFDEAGWFALAATLDRGMGYAIPPDSNGSFGNWKDVVQGLLRSELLRLHILISNGFATLTITRDAPMDTPDLQADQNDLIQPSWSWSYSDVYDSVRVIYKHREYTTIFYYGAPQANFSVSSNVARYLHRVSNQLDIETFHYEDEDAAVIANRFSAILSERKGILTGVLPATYMESVIGNTVQYGSKFLPGAAVDGQINERPYKLQRHAKSAQGVTVTLDDQKGIEDFSGGW